MRRSPRQAYAVIRAGRTTTGVALLCLAWAWPAAVLSFTVDFDVQPRVLTEGEVGTLVFTFTDLPNPPLPQVPAVQHVRISAAPSRSQNTMVVQGRSTTRLSYIYKIYPEQPGTYTIAPAPYRAQGQTVSLKPVTLTVAPKGSDQGEQLSDRLFARMSAERTRIYVQESVAVELAVYVRDLNLGGDFGLVDLPTSGLSFQDWQELGTEREIVDNRVYRVRRFRSKVRALTAGTFNLSPRVRVPVMVQNQGGRRGIFDMMWNMARTERVDVVAEAVTIDVLPLPAAGRPDSFTGAVGTYHFEVQAKPLQLQAGEPVTITMQIAGSGNIDSVSAPVVELGPQFKVYEPRLLVKEAAGAADHGRKVFEQVVIPRDASVSEIPPIPFSYFDPAAEKYRTSEQGPFVLQVEPSTGVTPRVVQPIGPDLASGGPELLQRDIVYLKSPPARWSRASGGIWFLHPAFLGAQALPPMLALGFYFVTRRRRVLSRDVARARRLRAPRSARAGIAKAEQALKDRANKGFYEAVWEALSTYFGNRLNLPPGEVTEDRVADDLAAGGMGSDSISTLRELFRVCEQARFGVGLASAGPMSASEAQEAALTLERLNMILRESDRAGRARS